MKKFNIHNLKFFKSQKKKKSHQKLNNLIFGIFCTLENFTFSHKDTTSIVRKFKNIRKISTLMLLIVIQSNS